MAKLPKSSRRSRLRRFLGDVFAHTPFVRMLMLLVVAWLLFSSGVYYGERGVPGTAIRSFGDALYWGVAAFSTAGIASEPLSGQGKLIGAVWIVFGSALFFGAIVATITTYFMRPLQRPHRRIIETIEYNLEQLQDLSPEELDLLKETTDSLIEHMERLKQSKKGA
jgi:voltage-gated potassium channel